MKFQVGDRFTLTVSGIIETLGAGGYEVLFDGNQDKWGTVADFMTTDWFDGQAEKIEPEPDLGIDVLPTLKAGQRIDLLNLALAPIRSNAYFLAYVPKDDQSDIYRGTLWYTSRADDSSAEAVPVARADRVRVHEE